MSLIFAPGQLVERIICSIIRYTTKINCVDDQISFGKVIERNDSGVHKATTAPIYWIAVDYCVSLAGVSPHCCTVAAQGFTESSAYRFCLRFLPANTLFSQVGDALSNQRPLLCEGSAIGCRSFQ
jgi:hypothetical protein